MNHRDLYSPPCLGLPSIFKCLHFGL